MTNKELLIRLDERQKTIFNKLGDIEKKLNGKVDHDEDYAEMKNKVTKLWDWKNKVEGKAAVLGALAGAIAALVMKLIESKLGL